MHYLDSKIDYFKKLIKDFMNYFHDKADRILKND